MARFFGCNLKTKQQLDGTVLGWLKTLDDSFTVFIEVEGSDFSVDFLVFKEDGIFNLETKRWNVREARADADWLLDDGRTVSNPFLTQILDQCTKLHDYMLVQRDEIFSKAKAEQFFQERQNIKIFPVAVISNPHFSGSIGLHAWRKIFANSSKLITHLRRYAWYPNGSKKFRLTQQEIEALARLLHLASVDPNTLESQMCDSPPVVDQILATEVESILQQPLKLSGESTNPYQYTYTVTGDGFYGRQMELTRVRRALEGALPIALIGLQRTGKSSLARESIRRYTEGSPQYMVVEFDFRRLKDESPNPADDITLEFIRRLLELSGSATDQPLQEYRDMVNKSSFGEQRRLFREMLKKNKSLGRRTILFLDECQEIGEFLSEERYRTFMAYLDALCRDRELGLNIILACRPAFFDLKETKDCNLGRLLETISLGSLEEAPAMDVIDRGRPPLQIDSTAVSQLQHLTGNHPFWLQFLCHRIFEDCVLKGNALVDKAKVDTVFQRILNDVGCKAQFYVLYQEVEDHLVAFDLLKNIAEHAEQSDVPVNIAEMIPEYKTTPGMREAIGLLSDNQIVVFSGPPAAPSAKFQVEALRLWLRSHLLTL